MFDNIEKLNPDGYGLLRDDNPCQVSTSPANALSLVEKYDAIMNAMNKQTLITFYLHRMIFRACAVV